jgi:zinc protease
MRKKKRQVASDKWQEKASDGLATGNESRPDIAAALECRSWLPPSSRELARGGTRRSPTEPRHGQQAGLGESGSKLPHFKAPAALLALALVIGTGLRLAARDLPPDVPPPRPIALPVPVVRTFPNGLRVLAVERGSLPVITLRLVVKAGSDADPPDLPGTAAFVASMLNEGTRDRSPLDIAEAIDSAGGSFDSGADRDSSFAELTVLADHAELAFDLLADMILHPAFAPAEVERIRRQTISALQVLPSDPSYLADAVFDRLVFAGTGYSHPAEGTLATAHRLTPQDLARFQAREYLPEQSVLAVVGDIAVEAAFGQAARYFGGWARGPEAPPPAPPPSAHRPPAQVVIVDKPDAVQTEIRVGNAAIPRSSADYEALVLANQILGGPASNRLFSDLRSEHGLAYGASSDLDCYATTGSWEAKTSTRTSETARALERVLEEMKKLRERPLRPDELGAAVSYLIGHQALDFETSGGIAGQFLDLLTYNLTLDTWSRFPLALRNLSPADVWTATRGYLDPDHPVIVLVGQAAAFEGKVRKLGPTRVIPIDTLDLGSPSLVKD